MKEVQKFASRRNIVQSEFNGGMLLYEKLQNIVS